MTQMVFVLSTGRTGTKFLAEYFNANFQNVLALHEPKPSYNLRLYANAYVDGRISKQAMIAALRRSRRHIMRALAKPIYIEATGYIYGFVDVLDEFAENPTILHIMRDPRDFVRSAHNHGSHRGRKLLATKFVPYWYPPVRRVLGSRAGISSIGVSAAKWVLVNRTLLDRGPRHPGYHLIKFEDIFDETNSGLRQVCAILDLDFVGSEGRISPTEKVNRGKLQQLPHWRQWTADQCRELNDICSPLMQEYGYGLESEWQEKIGGQVQRA